MIKWFKAQSASVKGMIIIAVMLLVGIIVRWDYVSAEVSEAFSGWYNRVRRERITE